MKIKQIIHSYFGSVEHEVKIHMQGIVAHVSISYTDHLPKYIVLSELLQRISMPVDIQLTRRYSHTAVCHKLLELYESNLPLWIEDEQGKDGQLRHIGCHDLIDELLFCQNLSQSPNLSNLPPL